MGQIRFAGVFLFSCIFYLPLLAQQTVELTGKITDQSSGEALESVSVTVGKKGAFTKKDGTFTLAVPENSASISFSYTGFIAQTMRISNQREFNVQLVRETSTEANVVVIGYGTSRKKDLTGSVTSVSAKEIGKQPITRVDQFIQGRASGVQVIQNDPSPGGNVSIRIRGTNSINSGNEPLFVIDGFPGVGNLNTINPADIESIEILKDASATAIYGSRGANGVVLVTTKKGKAGKQVINFETYHGAQNVIKTYDLMNAREFAVYADSVVLQNNRIAGTSTALPFRITQLDSLGEGTNWQNEVLRSAPISSYQLSIAGGVPDTRYNLSMGYFNQQGVIINSFFKRGTIRFNFDKTISPKIKTGLTSQLAFSNQNNAAVNTVGGAAGGTIYDALRFSPVLPVKDLEGNYTYQNGPQPYFDPAGNPVAYATSAKDVQNNLRTLLNIYAEYEIAKGLRFKILGGTDVNYGTRDFYTPSTLYITTQNLITGAAIKQSNTSFSWVNENTLSYDKKIGEASNLNAVVGMSAQSFVNGNLSAAANGFFTDQLGTDNIGIGATPLVPGSNKNKNNLASFFGRLNYRLADKYLFTATMRADGSSRFGEGNKWGYFPSGAFAWKLGEEKFIEQLKVFSDLKLRVGYGVTGNQEIGSYQSLLQYTSNAAYTLGGTRVVGVVANNIPNRNLTWESTASYDVGLDFGVAGGRISGTVDYYYKKTNDLLFNAFIPNTSGFTSKLINAGSVENKGLEVALNINAIDTKDFQWNLSGNISFNRNKVLDLNGSNNLLAGNSSNSVFAGTAQPTSILRIGQPIGSFYGYKFDGIWQNAGDIIKSGTKQAVRPGDPRYVDLNGDSTITGMDRTIIGNALPKFTYGFTTNIQYKRWALNIFLQGVEGVNIFNQNLYELQNGFTTTNKLKKVATDSWRGEGTSNTLPRVSSTLRRGTGITSDVIEDGSYLRVRTVSLSYGADILGGKVITAYNIYVTGQNLFTFTNYSGYDPEVNSFGNNSNANNLSLNTDYNSYPASKSVILGLRLTF
jgi:TonB-linked SusC/RagA family outer membrane protein